MVQLMDLWCAWALAVCLRLGWKEHSDCVEKLPFCCPLPPPVVIPALPASIWASSICFPLNIIPQVCVHFLQATENVVYLWFLVCKISAWDGICLTEYGPLKSHHFWSQIPKAVKGHLGGYSSETSLLYTSATGNLLQLTSHQGPDPENIGCLKWDLEFKDVNLILQSQSHNYLHTTLMSLQFFSSFMLIVNTHPAPGSWAPLWSTQNWSAWIVIHI